MAINNNLSVPVKRWVSPRHDTVDPVLIPPSGNPMNCHEEVLPLQPVIPPNKRFDIFPPVTGRCSEGLDARSDFSLEN